MTKRSDHKRLLEDVLAESSSPDFRTALLGEVLLRARRRRRWRQSRPVVAVVLAAIFLIFRLPWHNRIESLSAISKVRTIPLETSYQLVATQPFPVSAIVDTANLPSVSTVSSPPPTVQIATSSSGFRYLNDNELLQLAGPGTAILIRTGPHSEELVFADAAKVSKPSPEN